MTDSQPAIQTVAKNVSAAGLTTSTARSFECLALGQYTHAQVGVSRANTSHDDMIRDDISHTDMSRDNKGYRKLLALPAYYWVLIAQVIVILPHAAHLPLWLIGFAVVTIVAQLPRVKARFKKLHH